MPGYIALLRAINVGGRAKLPMQDLAGIFTELGCTEVRTYIQSGNVVFEAPAPVARGLDEAVPDAIEKRFGFRPPVLLRTASQLATVLEGNPFIERGVATNLLHVAFLAGAPSKERVAALDPGRSPGDEFEVRGKEVYLHFPNGVGRSKLTNEYLDRTLGTTSTVRNWRTVEMLASMLSA